MTDKDFINKWSKLLSEEGIKKFPDDFTELIDCIKIELPKQTLIPGKEFFGSFEVLTASGEVVYQANDFYEVKFIVYAGRNRSGQINLPASKDKIKSATKKYELYLDSLLSRVETDYKKDFPDGKNFPTVSNKIFTSLNLIRY